MGGCGIQIKVILLNVLAVVAFMAGETEEPFFQDWVVPVPERKREAYVLVTVAQAGETVFVPPVDA
jgi:hypothetical protein